RHTRFSRDWSSDVCSSDLWCGERNGRVRVSRPPCSVPATDATIETSSASAASRGGKIPGKHEASSDFPAPGGPLISILCPPAAEIGRASCRERVWDSEGGV